MKAVIAHFVGYIRQIERDGAMTCQIYIGSNNQTNELEIENIQRIASINHDGFTLYQATGYWLGKPEQTAVLIISDSKEKIDQTIVTLKYELKQDAIGYQVLPSLKFA